MAVFLKFYINNFWGKKKFLLNFLKTDLVPKIYSCGMCGKGHLVVLKISDNRNVVFYLKGILHKSPITMTALLEGNTSETLNSMLILVCGKLIHH